MKRIIIALTLAMALILGIVALAETADATAPAEQIEQTAPAEQTEPTAPEDAETEAPAAEETTLEDAFKALGDARFSARMDALQAELDEYVAAGKLTQEQADLIVNSLKEKQEDNGRSDCRKGGCRHQSRGNRQIPGQQNGGQMPQAPGQQGGSQMPQAPGQQGGNQMPQAPGQQGGNQMPQMPGQFPGPQGGM